MHARIAITGSSGHLGKALIAALVQDPAVLKIVAIDRHPVDHGHAKVDARTCDVRDPHLARHLTGCSALVHLAFIVHRRGLDEQAIDAINVGGTKNAVVSAAAAGVGHIVYASSIAAYGFHASHRGRVLDERTPIRGNDRFFYSRTKAACEHWLDDFEADHPNVKVARLRPCTWFGSFRELPYLLRAQPVLPYVAGDRALVNLCHLGDVVQAFRLALARGAHGAYNVAAEHPVSPVELARQTGKLPLPLPAVLIGGLDLAYRAGLTHIDPVWFRVGVNLPIVVSSEKIRRELRWRPRFDSAGAVMREALGCPGARASLGTRMILGTMAAITQVRGRLPTSPEQRGQLATTIGRIDLMLTGDRASEWHFSFDRGRIGLYRGMAPVSRATVFLDETALFALLTRELDWTTAYLTGQVRVRGASDYGLVLGGVIAGIADALATVPMLPQVLARTVLATPRDAEDRTNTTRAGTESRP